MTEQRFYAVFNRQTEAYVWGGRGDATVQEVGEDLIAYPVPRAALLKGDGVFDYDALRDALVVGIDNQAEQVRARFVTALPAQIGTYVLKEAAARAWLADNTASTVMLAPEASARGMTVAVLANEVIANADAWCRLSGAIEGLRFAAKARIAGAATIGAIVEAAMIDWSVLNASAA